MPKVINCEQGSPEWIRIRTGLPTSSCFDMILTASGKPSSSRDRYMRTLLAEVLMDKAVQGPTIAILQRGKDLEATAVEYYEMQRDAETVPVGIVLEDGGRYGSSPDRFVGKAGILEVKCPTEATHIGYLLMQPASSEYWAQIQGQLLVTEREWVDIVSYHPDMPMAVSPRVYRDERYIAALSKALDSFCAEFEEHKQTLRTRGYLAADLKQPDPMEIPADMTFPWLS